MRTIVWFRHDLRLADNTALHTAARRGEVVPCVCLDPFFLENPSIGPNRIALFLRAVQALAAALNSAASRLIVLRGTPEVELPALAGRAKAEGVVCNRDYEPYALERDQRVEHALRERGLTFESCKDLVIFERGEILTHAGKPYTIFSQYRRTWLLADAAQPVLPVPKLNFPSDLKTLQSELVNVDAVEPESTVPAISESQARKLLREFLAEPVFTYAANRDLPAVEGTSRLSVHLKFGTLSPRTVYEKARALLKTNPFPQSRKSIETFLSELIWRDFFFQIMAEFPRVAAEPFREHYRHLKWETDESRLDAWRQGLTGYPIVDAGMRQLKATGWMHNRVRMITASFLCKDLLQNWQAGERHFSRLLIDGEPAVNNGNWQWAASTGTDAQPFFRIFNPTTQAQKFDPEGAYVRRWIPELKRLEPHEIHEPWTSSKNPTYPPPIVDHAAQRIKAIELYRSSRNDA